MPVVFISEVTKGSLERQGGVRGSKNLFYLHCRSLEPSQKELKGRIWRIW